MARLKPEVREAIRLLRQSDLVKSVDITWYEISVKFKTGIRENWILNPRKNQKKRFSLPFPYVNLFGREIKTFCEFQTKLFDDAYNASIAPCFRVQYRDIKRAGFIDVRLKVQELVRQLYSEGWIQPQYPLIALRDDLRRVDEYSLDTTVVGNLVNAYSTYRQPGYIISSNFCKNWGDIEEPRRRSLKKAWKMKSVLYRAINKIIHARNDITRSELIRTLAIFSSKKHGPRFISPVFYRGILERVLKVEKPVILDPTPGYGSVAVATSLVKGSMLYDAQSLHFDPLALGKYLNISINKYNGENVDAVIFGTVNHLNLDDVKLTVNKYKSKAKNILCFVSKDDLSNVVSVMKPKRVMKALLTSLADNIDYMLVY